MTENLIGVLNDHLSAMIDLIVRRLSAPIINEFLKTRLFSALLQCFIYNHSIAASKMQSI